MDYFIHIVNQFLIMAIVGVSLNLLLGYTGLMSLGHGAFFALGAYGSALAVKQLGASFFVAMLIGVAIAAILGALTSIPALRVKGEYLILLTLAIQMVVYGTLVVNVEFTGGSSGLHAIPRPEILGIRFSSPASYVPLILAFTAFAVAVSWRIAHSPFGRVLKAMRNDEMAIRSLGKNVFGFKVLVFVVSACLAAIAGTIFAFYLTSISPSAFSVDVSILIVAIVIVGGTANIWGSVLGAFLLVMLPQALTFLPGAGSEIGAVRMALYGLLLILFMRFRPQGILPEYGRRASAALVGDVSPPPARSVPQLLDGNDPGNGHQHGPSVVATNEFGNVQQLSALVNSGNGRQNGQVVVEIEGLAKNFGGLRALDRACLSLPKGKITALIGPNGAGKTTLFHVVTGFVGPDEGTIRFRGKDITRGLPHKIAAMGMVRSFQDVRVFPGMSVLDNVLVACPDQTGENLALLFVAPWKVAREERENRARAMVCLDFVGLAAKAQELAGDISFAEQKLLALARLLATGADVLLLDEVVSGIDPMSIDMELRLIRQLAAAGKTICIIEHNLDVVKGVADYAYFMAAGQVIASGTPAELMASQKLVDIYFGTGFSKERQHANRSQ